MKRKSLIAISLCLSMSGAFNFPVMAVGIPTISITEITQMIMNAQQQAQQALDQLNAAKSAIEQAKSQYEQFRSVTEGNDKLGNFLSNPLVNHLLPVSDWQDIYTQTKDLSSLRSRYGLTSSDANVQAAFDRLLSQAGVLEDQYAATQTRVQTAEGLRTQLNTVVTPKDREQLALRYQQELVEQQNQKAQLDNTRYLMEDKDKIEDARKAQALRDYLDGKSKVNPGNS
ncbi:type IV secretion system protein [Rahnella perminowiae]|uniref:type IV secretion system protein n=1 Tax=Rahnella perminowiae TaxID=2816244 RepID=UPI00215BC6B6|nr:type IV secretion system protein [Rahnella perminowiae]MCR8998683.1 type IV secretion system protein [Rahnella perminowiae]MCR8998741.1 type IV secretion system protein [Rahnella perminowiae]